MLRGIMLVFRSGSEGDGGSEREGEREVGGGGSGNGNGDSAAVIFLAFLSPVLFPPQQQPEKALSTGIYIAISLAHRKHCLNCNC